MSWNPLRASLALAVLCCLGPQAAALQDPQPEPEEENTPIQLPGMVDQAQEEMLQLFRDIEQNLRKVDILLSDAGAGDTEGLAEVQESGIGRLLEDTRDRSEQVLQDIDRLLEIAEEMGQQSGGSGESGEPQSQQGDSPGSQGSSSTSGTQTTRREQTPETPGEESPGQTPQPGEQPNGQEPGNEQQPPSQGERPTDGQDPSNTDPNLRPGSEPPTDPTGAGSPNDPTSDRWGDLPVHVQDVFRGEDSEQMPPRYREWIDAYYRRLNRRGGR
jgi:hypothetical protein